MDSYSLLGPQKEAGHGTKDFPLAVYHSRPSLRKCVLYSHWHDEAEFFHLTHGKLSLLLDERSFELEAGQAVFIGGGEVHTAFARSGAPVSFTAIVFSLDMLASDFLGSAGDSVWRPFLRGDILPVERVFSSATDIGRAIIDRIESIAAERDAAGVGHEASVLASLFSVFAGIITRGGMDGHRQGKSDRGLPRLQRLKSALRYVRDNAYKEISVEDIAKQAHMSQYHFSRFFKEMTGCSPIEYVLRLRIERAEKLLCETEGKIQDIATAVGFRAASHFIKTFKRHKGCTPAAFRAGSREDRPSG